MIAKRWTLLFCLFITFQSSAEMVESSVYNGFTDENADMINPSLTDLEEKSFCRSISDEERHCITFNKGIMTDFGNVLFGHAPIRQIYSLAYKSGVKTVFVGQGPLWKESPYTLKDGKLLSSEGLVFEKADNADVEKIFGR